MFKDNRTKMYHFTNFEVEKSKDIGTVIDLSVSDQIDFALKKYNTKYGIESGHLHLIKPIAIVNILFEALGIVGAYPKKVAMLYDLDDTSLEELKSTFPELISYLDQPLVYPQNFSLFEKAVYDIQNVGKWDMPTTSIRVAELIYNLRSLNACVSMPGWTKQNILTYMKWCIILSGLIPKESRQDELMKLFFGEILKRISLEDLLVLDDQDTVIRCIEDYLKLIIKEEEKLKQKVTIAINNSIIIF